MWQSVPIRTARGFRYAAVAPHELAAGAAIRIMSAGGNAVDGAIAANAVQGVVAPETCGVGGDLFALVHLPGTDRPACLNSSGRAGSGADATALREAGHTVMPEEGPTTVTVPGCVDGWYALSQRYGNLRLREALGPAIELAREGFPTSRELSRTWTTHADRLRTQASAPPMFPHGQPPRPGQWISRPYLAETLEAAGSGRDTFYLDRIATGVGEATGGLIDHNDLARNQANWVEPLELDLFGWTAWTPPPNSQGYLTLATLSIFAGIAPRQDPGHPDYWHTLIEAYRSVAWERDLILSDPQGEPSFVGLDPEKLSGRQKRIDPRSAMSWPAPDPAVAGTAYMCTVDRAGMAVSLIQSNFSGIGSGLSAGRTGVWLHNRGAGFNLTQGHPNEWRPGRRPLHTLSPTIWTRPEGSVLVLGTRGGHQQPQLLAQMAAHVHHGGLTLAEAQAVPRWTLTDIDGKARVRC